MLSTPLLLYSIIPALYLLLTTTSTVEADFALGIGILVYILVLTGDAGLIAPVGIVCILAMLVGNIFNHGLYHGLIPIMNLPYLNAQPAHVMYVTRVVSIMSKRLTYLPQMCRAAELKMLKKRCDSGKVTHHGFPVVRRSFDKHLVGLLSRKALYHVLRDLDSKYIFIT
jgi:hypothetical protein